MQIQKKDGRNSDRERNGADKIPGCIPERIAASLAAKRIESPRYPRERHQERAVERRCSESRQDKVNKSAKGDRETSKLKSTRSFASSDRNNDYRQLNRAKK